MTPREYDVLRNYTAADGNRVEYIDEHFATREEAEQYAGEIAKACGVDSVRVR